MNATSRDADINSYIMNFFFVSVERRFLGLEFSLACFTPFTKVQNIMSEVHFGDFNATHVLGRTDILAC